MNLRPRQAAERLGVDPATLRRWRKEGRLRSLKMSNRLHVYPEEAIEEFEKKAKEAAEGEVV